MRLILLKRHLQKLRFHLGLFFHAFSLAELLFQVFDWDRVQTHIMINRLLRVFPNIIPEILPSDLLLPLIPLLDREQLFRFLGLFWHSFHESLNHFDQVSRLFLEKAVFRIDPILELQFVVILVRSGELEFVVYFVFGAGVGVDGMVGGFDY